MKTKQNQEEKRLHLILTDNNIQRRPKLLAKLLSKNTYLANYPLKDQSPLHFLINNINDKNKDIYLQFMCIFIVAGSKLDITQHLPQDEGLLEDIETTALDYLTCKIDSNRHKEKEYTLNNNLKLPYLLLRKSGAPTEAFLRHPEIINHIDEYTQKSLYRDNKKGIVSKLGNLDIPKYRIIQFAYFAIKQSFPKEIVNIIVCNLDLIISPKHPQNTYAPNIKIASDYLLKTSRSKNVRNFVKEQNNPKSYEANYLTGEENERS